MLFLLRTVSLLLAALPDGFCRVFVAVLADLTYYAMPRRRRTILSNLSHAFPDRPHDWLVRVARKSCRRTMETGLVAMIYPRLSPDRLRRMVRPGPGLTEAMRRLAEQKRPLVLGIPHLGAWELATALPLVCEGPKPVLSCAYRPLRNPHLEAWVRSARERFGTRLLSRKQGFAEGMRILRAGGVYSILFDQHAGESGRLVLFLDRICSCTTLPGLMVEKFDALLGRFHVRRTGFWRYELMLDIAADRPRTAEEVTADLNRWLEGLLRSDDETCASWLWLHNRWKAQQAPASRFRLEREHSLLPPDEALPRRTRFLVRLPDDPDEAAALLPLLRTLRASRPDAALTALAPAGTRERLDETGLFEQVVALPAGNLRRLAAAWRLRRRFPDAWVSFTEARGADLEGWLAGARQRFGVLRAGRRRPLLTHGWRVPPELAGVDVAPAEVREAFLRHFGLEGTDGAARGRPEPLEPAAPGPPAPGPRSPDPGGPAGDPAG